MIAFDTNIPIYILNNHPQFYAPAKSILRTAQEQAGCASVLLVTELLQYSLFNDSRQLKIAEQFIESMDFVDFAPVDNEIARQAAAILRACPQLRLPDAIHLASAIVTGASEFWTNDRQLTSITLDSLRIKSLSSAC